MNGSIYVKLPLRSSTFLNFDKDNEYCFLWSILAILQPCKNSHPNKVTKYRQYFDQLKVRGFDFTNGFKYNDVHQF